MLTSVAYRSLSAERFIKQSSKKKKVNIALDIASAEETSEMIIKGFNCRVTRNRIINADSLKYSFSQYSDKIDILEGRIEDVLDNIADNTYDLVFAGEIIEHVYDIDKLFTSILRVLTKGGIFAGTTPNLASLYNRILILEGQNPLNYSPWPIGRTIFKTEHSNIKLPLYEYHIRVGNPSSLMRYLKSTGFKNIHYTTIEEHGSDLRFPQLRRIFNKVLPKNTKSNIIFYCEKDTA